jgi:hypothetical protein
MAEKGNTQRKKWLIISYFSFCALCETYYITGLRDHVQGDNLTFFWKSSCDFPKLQKDKQYLIIGKDGFRTQDANGNDTYVEI